VWTTNPSSVACRLSSDEKAWLLSGTEIAGDWALEATFEPPFAFRDEGLLINVDSSLTRGYLVSLGPMGKLSLLRIKKGEVDSVAIDFPVVPSLTARKLKVTRVGASYDFWVDGEFVGNIANPLQERVEPARWTSDSEPDSGQYGFAFFKSGAHLVRNISATALHLEQKHTANPILKPVANWETNGIFTGGILKEGDTYYLYYSGTFPSPPAKDQPPEGITRAGVAVSKDLENWTRGPNNPVLEEGAVGNWDRALQVGCVVRGPDGRYAMFYDGYDGKRWGGIGVSFSDTPLGPFRKYAANPVLQNGGPREFDFNHIHLHTCTRLDDGRYVLLYTGFRAAGPKERSGDRGGLAFSNDLIHWTKSDKNPVLDLPPVGTFSDRHGRPKGIIKLGQWYYLFFEGAHFDKLWFDQASVARSKDLVNWERFPYPLPSMGTGDSYDSIVTEWPVPVVSPKGDLVILYMCLPLKDYGKKDRPTKLSICTTRVEPHLFDHWDEFMTPLTRASAARK
jgi:predicted GH43/DUF377 family glycosyl hydrolase